jgi:D-alanyl-D-alanine carboxypeptidase
MRTIFLAIGAWAAASSLCQAEAPPSGPEFDVRAEALINGYVKAGNFSGAVLVARDGEPILREGFGLANREWDIAAAPDTEFRIGSMTKPFTATAIMQLVEQGKINLDDPISKYYTGAPQAWSKVTIRILLTHRSGIPNFTDIPHFLEQQSRLDRTPEEIIALTRDLPLEFEPGTKYKYDNSGYILLGYVIEKVSGQRYADYLRDHIFKPLGMDHTGYDVSEEVQHHRAAGYELGNDGVVRNASYVSMTLPYAAGGLYSDVDDLLVWDQAYYAGKLLTPASMADMFTAHSEHYGYGWEIQRTNGRRVWWHTGSLNGFHAYIGRYPDQKLTVIVLANIFQAPVQKIGDALASLNFGEMPESQAKPGAAPRQ